MLEVKELEKTIKMEAKMKIRLKRRHVFRQ